MGSALVLAFCNTKSNVMNKLDTQNLQNEITITIPSLGLADVSIHVVAMHQLLAQPILSVSLQDGFKILRRPPAAQPVLGHLILDQPINCPKKVLALGQVDAMSLCGFHMLLQHPRVVNNDRYQAGVFEGILDHLPCNVIEHGGSFNIANSIHQMKMFLHAREN
jgi:hypothetical protein